jgi:hypothetical protein
MPDLFLREKLLNATLSVPEPLKAYTRTRIKTGGQFEQAPSVQGLSFLPQAPAG